MNKNITPLLFLSLVYTNLYANTEKYIYFEKLKNAYPEFIKDFSKNKIIWYDNYEMPFDDQVSKITLREKLDNPTLMDQLSIKYKKVSEVKEYIPLLNEDPGRIRYEPFFKKMYGSNKEEVKAKLTKINWLPKSSNKILLITKVNGIDKKVQAISDELELLPKELKSYVSNPDGAFIWRKISKTNRISVHSFGIAIDLNVKKSHYWRWDKAKNNFSYKNNIPLEIVEIFEKNGFIWGGRWYHYDTMHFEYRPELLN